jgi:class 3 adenylate cyclase
MARSGEAGDACTDYRDIRLEFALSDWEPQVSECWFVQPQRLACHAPPHLLADTVGSLWRTKRLYGETMAGVTRDPRSAAPERAAHLEPACPPLAGGHPKGGQVLPSEAVRQIVAPKKSPFSGRGETVLRGFEDPVRIYDVIWWD